KNDPHVLVLDLNMPGPSPIETVTAIHDECPNVKVIVLTGHTNDTYVRTLVELGVDGYVFKDETPETIAQAIMPEADGGSCVSQSILATLVRRKTNMTGQNSGTSLSNRDLEILRLIVSGHTDQQISQKLGLADRTVRYRLRTIYTKLQVQTRVEAAVQAVRLKL